MSEINKTPSGATKSSGKKVKTPSTNPFYEEEEEEEERREVRVSDPPVTPSNNNNQDEADGMRSKIGRRRCHLDFDAAASGNNHRAKLLDKDEEDETGSKTLNTAWREIPMIREAVEGIKEVHDKEVKGEGWLNPVLYKKTLETASNIVQKSVETTKNLTNKTKEKLPNVVQKSLESGVYLADGIGAKSVSTLAHYLPLVGDSSAEAKEKTINTGKNLACKVTETWAGQKTLKAIDRTLHLAEKPLAIVGKVDLQKKLNPSIEDSSSDRSVKCNKRHSKCKKTTDTVGGDSVLLLVHKFNPKGQFIRTVRYLLGSVRRTRRKVRSAQRTGLKTLMKKEKSFRRKQRSLAYSTGVNGVTPKSSRRKVMSIADVGKLGYLASVFHVDKLLKVFGLRIIPADGHQARQVLFPNMKLVHKFASNPAKNYEETPQRVVEKLRCIRKKKILELDCDESDEDSYDEAEWIKQMEAAEDVLPKTSSDDDLKDPEDEENKDLANTSLDSIVLDSDQITSDVGSGESSGDNDKCEFHHNTTKEFDEIESKPIGSKSFINNPVQSSNVSHS